MIGWVIEMLGVGRREVVAQPPPPPAKLSAAADRLQGSILLGAVADAYGYVVEFRSGDRIAADIANGFGFDLPDSWSYDGIGHVVSDDTQMTLFTGEACCGPSRAAIHWCSPFLVTAGKPISLGMRPRRGPSGVAKDWRVAAAFTSAALPVRPACRLWPAEAGERHGSRSTTPRDVAASCGWLPLCSFRDWNSKRRGRWGVPPLR